ncbi:carbamoyl phosphate synthase small subunit [Evansella cellulosilytica]|uniref:Carbamoyl phosphate synthase small chain n=1 Tax=Evansella cellulosilytica (strain ATCC 21833 / DSM 2522 / FERM P-1141 / JCM 9156 / N-4) TaxID=649639 RepID=E6TYY5_EVAC2|nr:carbamoyl phosphate synthase small subunit [Evansella cellulosilytica]ADU32428.1 carbamoyl-phosphate synthase, small subunit [Evansella cellulosilytica DSM 2522]
MKPAYLVLETGEVFEGKLIGELNDMVGEVVFNTSMTGYQEILTDPSYAGQILTFCYPLIGNYGLNKFDDESLKTVVAGVITGDMCDDPSHYQATKKFSDELKEASIPGLTEVDTRALVKVIRKHHTVKGMITTEPSTDMLKKNGKDVSTDFWVDHVSTKEPVVYENDGEHVVLIDYGYKKSILHALLKQNCAVTVVPYYYSYEQIAALEPDGVLLSNGPGNPMKLEPWFKEIKRITESFPTLGICLGHQLIALAHGAKTKKLAFGHRGGNHPVKELTTGKVSMTAQNHGYVVIEDSINYDDFQVLFKNVNDKTVEGLKHNHLPIQSVQFHPEAHPGPSDTEYIFNQFLQQVIASGGRTYAKA